jgi:rhodanese-related sulfurtransferase
MIRLLYLLPLLFALSCSSPGVKKTGSNAGESIPVQETGAAVSSFEGPAALLLQQLRDQGDYVNSRQFPSMIKPETVFAELDSNNLVIDMRSPEYFEKGHIRGAANVRMERLLEYFENDIIPFRFDKIILVCYGGHLSGYATNLLRLMGYGNVYSMRWGMSGWNTAFAKDFWMKAISSDYQDRLSTEDVPKPPSAHQPVLRSSATTGEELLRERVSSLLAEGSKQIFAANEEVFGNPQDYFITNLERKDKYDSGHIPGAVRYKQQGFLGIPSEMGTLPGDKPIVVYCGTGMTSAFAVAYLRLFGYDARSLTYGNNGFMHQKMIDEQEQLSWHPFTDSTPNGYPFVKGSK